MTSEKRYFIADFSEIIPVRCPCGTSSRAFIAESGNRASFHVIDIKKDAERHYHKNHIEIYYVLKGTGFIEADNETIPLSPGKAVMIQELCRHRVIGKLKIANVSIPAYDPEDEWFD